MTPPLSGASEELNCQALGAVSHITIPPVFSPSVYEHDTFQRLLHLPFEAVHQTVDAEAGFRGLALLFKQCQYAIHGGADFLQLFVVEGWLSCRWSVLGWLAAVLQLSLKPLWLFKQKGLHEMRKVRWQARRRSWKPDERQAMPVSSRCSARPAMETTTTCRMAMAYSGHCLVCRRASTPGHRCLR